jgi:hypothetical protein
MTVTVTLPDGGTDAYMRSGDAYVKHNDGTLDVIRVGAQQPHRYASGVDQCSPTVTVTCSRPTRP